MFEEALERAGWTTTDDGLHARLPVNRTLPIILLVLLVGGGAMYGYFLAVADGPYAWPVYVAPVALLGGAYASVRALRNETRISFERGVFRCSSGALGLRESTSIDVVELVRFEGRPPAHAKDVAHVVAYASGPPQRLPIPVADAAPLGGGANLACAVAAALDEMLDRARRERPTYR